MKLSIIIVGYNTKNYILNCLNSIYNINHYVDLETIIVDNDSSDDSETVIKKSYPKVKWINMGYNSGFSRANNAGIKEAKGEFILILNPDTIVKEAFFQKFISFYEKNDKPLNLGLLGCRIKTIDGKELLVGSKRGFPSISKQILVNPMLFKLNKIFKFVKSESYDANKMHSINHEVDYLSGACLLIQKNKVIDNDLLMDEDFFLYSEDVDWSFRVKKAGFKNYFCAEVEVYHINSGATESLKDKKFCQIMLSRLLLIQKIYGTLYFLIYCWLVRLNNTTHKIFRKFGIALPENKEHEIMYLVIKQKFKHIWKNFIKNKSYSNYLKYD